ncbi:MAG: DNA mismatch repair endonuclease MutL [Myxococcota bacterium]|nr:DNA mismatch repair endonuclease MutL [Myxococcota bacterium]
MSRVGLLPSALADQIAAGEVIERPAAVVKELLENAIDAGASTVFVDVEQGGKTLVRVVDDGHGMGREDAVLAIRRHATSKLRVVEDLRAIGTLGFRGEALPSIASVSRFRLVTRAEGEITGTEVLIEGGQEPKVKDAAGPVGTRIEVRDLFYNVPARLKFLKRTATEMGHISTLVTGAALGYPHVHFRLTHNGRTSLDHPVAPSLRQRIFQVLGRRITEHLYEVSLYQTLRSRGYISDPACHRPNQTGITTFVNGRRIRDRVVNHAMVSAYGNMLDRGRYPHGVLYLHLPLDEVDVNVHPTKSEVRFVNRGQVHAAIVQACRQTLAESPWLAAGNPLYADQGGAGGLFSGLAEAPSHGSMSSSYGPVGGASRPPWRPQPSPQSSVETSPVALVETGEGGRFGRLRILGQAAQTFLICEDRDGLVIIDQHAAHERVGFERIKSGYCAARVSSQRLLLPLQLELAASESSALNDHLETVERLGFRLEPFGGETWQVTEVPALLAHAGVEDLLRDVITELVDIGQATLAESHIDMLFATMACHSVIRAGDVLKHEEIQALLHSMDEVDLGANCPHGRPVMVTVPFRDLERKLHRI